MSVTKLSENFEIRNGLSCFNRMASESSITGVKYIADSKTSEKARFFWIATFFLSIFGCIFYALQIYDKWYITPDIGVKTMFESSATIPFPAITICHQSKIKRKFLNYKAALMDAFINGSMGDESRKYFELALPLCTASHITIIKELNPNYTDIIALNGSDYISTMSEVQFALNQTFVGMKTDKGFSTEHFEAEVDRVMTSEGFCATYNLQDYPLLFRENSNLSSDFDCYKNNRNSTWNPHTGYSNNNIETFPKRIMIGKQSKVFFLLGQSPNDIDEACRGPYKGFKIYWHMPNEIPTFSNQSFILGVEKSKSFVMKVSLFRTHESMKKFRPEKRNCYFNDENKLRFFKSYTQSHCELECRSNFMLKMCGCVKFFMPRNSSTPVCDISKLDCSEDAENIYLEKNFFEDFHKCQCLPLCTQIKYEVKQDSDLDYPTQKTLEIFGDSTEFYEDFPNGTISLLAIKFIDHTIEVQENFSVYGVQQFISDCGGLLGLFMGCSVLSIVEIFYNIFSIALSRRHSKNEEKTDEKFRSKESVIIFIENEKLD